MPTKHAVLNIKRGRKLRDLREAVRYPIWLLTGAPPPDNHFYKTKRIREICQRYNCITFIETGTFFGQMVAAVHRRFKRTMSVELSLELYEGNRISFEHESSVKIFYGDSSATLGQMVSESTGRILYWLDGHFSGGVTACGAEVTPILQELETIKSHKRPDDCILIDDVRLFTGFDGYPKLEDVKKLIRDISPSYEFIVDRDCLLALPRIKQRERAAGLTSEISRSESP